MWHLMSPVYSWSFIYIVPALCVVSVLLLIQLVYLRKFFVFFDGNYFGVFGIYKHCNSVVICTSYCGTKVFVAESCSIKNLKNGLGKLFFLSSKLLVQRTSIFSLCSLMSLKWLLKHLFRPVLYANICLSLPIILPILSASEILSEASELFLDC